MILLSIQKLGSGVAVAMVNVEGKKRWKHVSAKKLSVRKRAITDAVKNARVKTVDFDVYCPSDDLPCRNFHLCKDGSITFRCWGCRRNDNEFMESVWAILDEEGEEEFTVIPE